MGACWFRNVLKLDNTSPNNTGCTFASNPVKEAEADASSPVSVCHPLRNARFRQPCRNRASLHRPGRRTARGSHAHRAGVPPGPPHRSPCPTLQALATGRPWEEVRCVAETAAAACGLADPVNLVEAELVTLLLDRPKPLFAAPSRPVDAADPLGALPQPPSTPGNPYADLLEPPSAGPTGPRSPALCGHRFSGWRLQCLHATAPKGSSLWGHT